MSPRRKVVNKAAFSETIGLRLEEIRRSADYTVNQMAGAMGISRITYRNNVKGNNTPTLQGLCRLADNLNVSLDWLLKGRGKMYYKQPPVFRGLNSSGDEKEEMEALMELMPLVRHSVMAYYQKFKFDNAELINQALQKKT
ncbi:MAG: helix-turn-helix transcriptional regulator [bacterium]|nr:helix-turn-helix transcriptional regulator [bacterium]